MTAFRIEEDTLGSVKIPQDALWGPQTERSRQHFATGPKMPLSIIRALLTIKRAAAQANRELNVLTPKKAALIMQAIHALQALDDTALQRDFPLSVYQTGSGTQTNMNVNEVVAHMAAKLDDHVTILPNDDVNCGQSSNDVFPTAMAITASLALQDLNQALQHLRSLLEQKQQQYAQVVKIGRTHLQDATPLTFGQEISGWISMLDHDLNYLQELAPTLYELPLGGTAVGTGLNAAPGLAAKMNTLLKAHYQLPLTVKTNKFAGLAAHSGLNVMHGVLKTLASDLLKIVNDVRFLGSGPRAGYGELKLPANEPGSSIMPGKVNPTQAEALSMAVVRVLGNDVTISMAASQGNFELNVYKPVIISTFLESVDLLTGTVRGFADKMIAGLTVNQERMQTLVDQSLMTVTALSPHLGYQASAKIAQQAAENNQTLKAAALASGLVSAADFDRWVDPLAMTKSEPPKKQD